MSEFRKALDRLIARCHFAPEPFADCKTWGDVQRVKDAISAEVHQEHQARFEEALKRIGK